MSEVDHVERLIQLAPLIIGLAAILISLINTRWQVESDERKHREQLAFDRQAARYDERMAAYKNFYKHIFTVQKLSARFISWFELGMNTKGLAGIDTFFELKNMRLSNNDLIIDLLFEMDMVTANDANEIVKPTRQLAEISSQIENEIAAIISHAVEGAERREKARKVVIELMPLLFESSGEFNKAVKKYLHNLPSPDETRQD